MGGNTDKAKGRIKQAIGALKGDEALKRAGRNDERTGRAKQIADDAIDGIRQKADDVADKLSGSEKDDRADE